METESSNGWLPHTLPDSPESLADLAQDLAPAFEVSADTAQSLERRLEAYEDIVDSEVGDTTMARARNLEREFGLRQLYLKFEGSNPTGTQKDRIAFAQAMDALRRGFETVTIATCGNYGVAMALACKLAGLRCLIFIPEKYHAGRIGEMQAMGAQIARVPGDYEAAVLFSQDKAAAEEYYDANPGGTNIPIQLRGYGGIAYEVYDDLRDAPVVCAGPVSNGTTMSGVYKGFLSLYRRGKTSRMPKMVVGSTYKKNPIVRAWLRNLPTCEDLRPDGLHETKINEPLINWHAIDGDLALDAVRNSNGWATDVSDKAMRQAAKMIRDKEGFNVLPASTAGLVALIEKHRQSPLPNDRYVVLLTGRKA